MTPTLELLDYSIHGNAIDADSDRLLAAAIEGEGHRVVVTPISPEREVRAAAERVWLRYDLRSRRELSWIVGVAHDLRRAGHRVFPAPLSILLASDKWETHHALRAAAIPTPDTWLLLEPVPEELPVLVKPRVGWGGMGSRVVRDPAESTADLPAEDTIGQPFLPHDRMWIVPVAGARELPAIEERRDAGHDDEARLSSPPERAAGLAAAAAAALGLPAATVDLLEGPEGPLVLEVNSAPRIHHPEVPGVDLAAPMARAVLAWMDRGDGRRSS